MKIKSRSLFLASVVIATGLSFTACTRTPTPAVPVQKKMSKEESVRMNMTEEEKKAAYNSALKKVGKEIKRDANYKRLDLSSTELKNWFRDITYKLWDHQISRGQFIAYGLEKYPDRAYEFEVIADGLLAS